MLAACLAALAIGMMLGWYARVIKDLLVLGVRGVQAKRLELKERREDQSGVISGGHASHRGKIVDVPDYDGESLLVRSPSPQEVKRQRQREHEEDLMRL